MDIAFSVKDEQQSACNLQLFYAILTYFECILDVMFDHPHMFVRRLDVNSQVALEVSNAAVEIPNPGLLVLRKQYEIDGCAIVFETCVSLYVIFIVVNDFEVIGSITQKDILSVGLTNTDQRVND